MISKNVCIVVLAVVVGLGADVAPARAGKLSSTQSDVTNARVLVLHEQPHQLSQRSALACRAWYKVLKGDTTTKIAKRYGVTVAALVAANKLLSANTIRVGQWLCIPGTVVAAPTPRLTRVWPSATRTPRTTRRAAPTPTPTQPIEPTVTD